jgi:hypothetical protein
MRGILRKVLRSNKTCLVLTGVLYLVTIWVRFVLAHETVPPGDWVLWIACNNLMIAGFAWQLGAISGVGKAEKKIQALRRKRDAIHDSED